jgi:hypothetical protein
LTIGVIGAHPRLQRLPVPDGEADVAEHPAQVGRELLPAPGVGAVELHVHHRFPAALVTAQRFDAQQLAVLVAIDADDRVKQPMDRQLPLGNGVGHRIDQERHVVVDHADAHPAPAGLAADRLNGERQLAAAALLGDLGEELCRVALRVAGQSLRFSWKCVSGQRLANRLDQRGVKARMGRHWELCSGGCKVWAGL